MAYASRHRFADRMAEKVRLQSLSPLKGAKHSREMSDQAHKHPDVLIVLFAANAQMRYRELVLYCQLQPLGSEVSMTPFWLHDAPITLWSCGNMPRAVFVSWRNQLRVCT